MHMTSLIRANSASINRLRDKKSKAKDSDVAMLPTKNLSKEVTCTMHVLFRSSEIPLVAFYSSDCEYLKWLARTIILVLSQRFNLIYIFFFFFFFCDILLISLRSLFATIFQPTHDKTNKMACAPSEDSDQPGHPPSLIRVFTVLSMGS